MGGIIVARDGIEMIFDRMKAAPNRLLEQSPGPNPQIGISDWRAAMQSTRHCSVEGCDRALKAKGLCGLHWQRVYRTGTTDAPKGRVRGTCTLDGCERAHYGKGMCHKHWTRARRNGSPEDTIRMLSFDEKWELYFPRAGEGCWEWRGPVDEQTGYGRIHAQWAHRVSYERNVGPIPEGLVIDHLCRNRACVRPDHLEVVTRQENNRRGNAPSFIAARTNQCHRGHSLEDAYIANRSNGTVTRRCRTCGLASERRRNAK